MKTNFSCLFLFPFECYNVINVLYVSHDAASEYISSRIMCLLKGVSGVCFSSSSVKPLFRSCMNSLPHRCLPCKCIIDTTFSVSYLNRKAFCCLIEEIHPLTECTHAPLMILVNSTKRCIITDNSKWKCCGQEILVTWPDSKNNTVIILITHL